MRIRKWLGLSCALIAMTLSACMGSGEADATVTDGVKGSPAQIPFVDDVLSGDPNHLTVALKFVEYMDASGQPVLTIEEAASVLESMNRIYATCNLSFRGEVYEPVNAADLGLSYNTQSLNDLDGIRRSFEDSRYLVVINTGAWNHASMGSANAWTMMPGATPSGAVIESAVAGNGPLVAHEIGHYLNLSHLSDTSNLMNPVIYSSSTYLSSSQCSQVRQAALTVRSGALR